MKTYNVLVFPGATEIGLEIHRSLCQCKDIRLFSAGIAPPGHAPFVFEHHLTVPSVHDPGWVEGLNSVVEAHAIDYVFPAHDDVIVALAGNSESLRSRIVTSPFETCTITRSKSRTYRYFAGSLRVPTMYARPESIRSYPVFVKPDKGQGSRDSRIVRDLDELREALKRDPRAVVLEYLPGDEYTVDCFSDRERGLLFCRGRRRVRTRSGISMNSVPVPDPRIQEIGDTISSSLVLHGAWFFQLKKDDAGNHVLLEIAPRIAGTMALHRVSGVNFPLLSIYEQERIPVEILCNDIEVEIDRALTNRYRHDLEFKNVYVDLDDMLIRNDRVNVRLVCFLYQCVNSGIKVILITKSDTELVPHLESYRLRQVFDEIIRVGPTASKADYVTDPSSIFIDDSYSERKAMHDARGIPTFDCSMIEMLFDERDW